MHNKALQFQEVSFAYKANTKTDVSMIESLNLDVANGEFISIVGASGSGKTTLFKLIAGLEQVQSGSIFVEQKLVRKPSGHVGYMPQQDLLMPWRTVLDNAALPLEIQGMKRNAAHQKVIELLQEFGLQGTERKFPSDLSGGMRQRVSFLRAVLSGANVLLLDEPFSALDAITRLSMQEWLLEQWMKSKKTVLFITHDVDEALFLSDRIFILTETPIRSLQEVPVPLSRPRKIKDMNRAEMLALKEQLIDELRTKVKL